MGARPKSEAQFQIEKDLVDLLGKLDLGHLSPVFVENQITMRDLQRLQAKDLQEIGIKKLMDRKLILEAAKEKKQRPRSGNLEDHEILLLTSSGTSAEYFGRYLYNLDMTSNKCD